MMMMIAAIDIYHQYPQHTPCLPASWWNTRKGAGLCNGGDPRTLLHRWQQHR